MMSRNAIEFKQQVFPDRLVFKINFVLPPFLLKDFARMLEIKNSMFIFKAMWDISQIQ